MDGFDRGAEPDRDRLRDAWDRVVQGESPAFTGLDPASIAVVRRLHDLYRPPAPDPDFLTHLEKDLLDATAPVAAIVSPGPIAWGDRVAARPGTDRIAPPGASVRRGWALTHLATAALLVLTLGSVFVAFGGRQLPELLTSPRRNGPDVSAATVRGNPARTGVNPGPGPAAAPEVRWALAMAALIEPVVADGTVYVATYDGFFHAFDAATGRERWRRDVGAPNQGYAPPAVAAGVVYVGLSDGFFYALDGGNGDVRWRYAVGTASCAAPAVVEGIVYGAAGCGQPGGTVFALDATTGKERWRIEVAGGRVSTPAVAGGTIFLAAGGLAGGLAVEPSGVFGPVDLATHLLALDAATGQTRWQFDTAGGIFSAPAVADGIVYVGSESGLWALAAANGSPVWRFRAEGSAAVWASPAVADGRVFVTGTNERGYLFALDARTGEERWRFKTWDLQYSTTGPTVVDGVVYVSITYGDVFALDAVTGAQRWDISINHLIVAAPTVVDGFIYLAADGLVALADPPAATPIKT
jgi:outer membrane protein assembly factor BamB